MTIEEKKASMAQKKEADADSLDYALAHVNQDLTTLRRQLEECYTRVKELNKTDAKEADFAKVLEEVNRIKHQMASSEKKWRDKAVGDAKREEEGYALWDQEETTLGQLVMEYGAMDYLYIVPPEMATLKLHMHSSIPIPRESWSDVLEIILAHNGIGVKKLNAYARQLYILKQEPSAIQTIISQPQDLLFVPAQARLFYVFSPPIEQVKSTFQFFERFADAKQTFVYQVGSKIAIVSSKEEVEKLLALYDTIWQEHKGKTSKVIQVAKMEVKEMERILQSFFGETIERARTPFGKPEQEGLMVLPLAQSRSLILIGQQQVVERAEKIVRDTEEQLQDPSEMTVFLYPCRHSDPTDLAKVLDKVYTSLLYATPEGARDNVELNYAAQGPGIKPPDGYAPNPPALANPPPPNRPSVAATLDVEHEGSEHFVPDPKTGTILMVIRRDTLAKIKELLRKLDVPKKMVQIEVLLFEKRLSNQNNFGLNLLKLGSKQHGVIYEGLQNSRMEEGRHDHDKNDGRNHHHKRSFAKGVFEFFFSGHKSKHFPAYDIAYSFLMAQEDIQLNAAPSIITVNQTPATISIVEEISINNGAAPIDTNKGIAFEKSFARAQYGITIVITPTVHLPDRENEEADGKGFVTLQTDITFDTTKPHPDDRPLVDKRHIENEVRVVDGQTVILGGLRRKASQDNEDKIPFFGEIPGIGKLFGSTKLTSNSTEMFFFITPKIILDPKEELDQLRLEELKKRPGDIPEFLDELVEARKKDEKKFFQNSLKMFLQS